MIPNSQSQPKTKIVATIGPASDSPQQIEALIKAGVNVFRFNMKHGDVAWHNERMERVQQVADRIGSPIGILIDLQGPEIRINTLNAEPMSVKKDETFLLSAELIEGKKSLAVKDVRIIEALSVGDEVLIDDAAIELDVVGKYPEYLEVKARADYEISNRKGMNLPGVKLTLDSLIKTDLEKLDLAQTRKVDFVALSFVRSAEDIRILREEMAKRGVKAQVVAKIENAHALENLESILMASDAVMVARGDLGVEVPLEELAYWQKKMIQMCRQMAKPVITATQMLQSMIEAPRPTRAEVTDVANAVLDGSDAIMLSGETAQGKYPEKAVAMMRKIANFNEEKVTLPELTVNHAYDQAEGLTSAAHYLLASERQFKIDAVVIFTETGSTARKIARFHPRIPIIAITDLPEVRDQLTLVYGVIPFHLEFPEGDIVTLDPIFKVLKEQGVVESGNRLLVLHGHKWRTPGLTNTMTIKEVA